MNGRPNNKLFRISPKALKRAKSLCSARGALPKDWDDWFPSTIPLVVRIDGADITIKHLIEFAKVRLEHLDDPNRFLEVAQCVALIHYLGNPPLDAVVASVF